jgi:hypothetical protein
MEVTVGPNRTVMDMVSPNRTVKEEAVVEMFYSLF